MQSVQAFSPKRSTAAARFDERRVLEDRTRPPETLFADANAS